MHSVESESFRKMKGTDKDQQNSYFQDSHSILCELSTKMLKHDIHKILGPPQEMDFMVKTGITLLNQRSKKLFHIDVKNRQIYWELSSEETKYVRKQCLLTKQLRHKWRFEDKQIGSQIVIEVLGKHKYKELNTQFMMREETLETINMNVLNNAYTNFDEFFGAVVSIINQNLVWVFEGRMLNKKYDKDKEKKEKIHQCTWEWYSYEMTKFWKFFWDNLNTSGKVDEYTLTLYQELDHLFKQNSQYKCKEGLTHVPYEKFEQLNYSCINKTYRQEFLKKNFDNSLSLDYRSLPFDLDLDFSQMRDISATGFLRFPDPENYPLTDTIEFEDNYDEQMSHFMRKSLKRPANSCHQNCLCLKDDGIKCPNMERKVECQNHSCSNSQIREKKDIFCWYMDDQKNYIYRDQLASKLNENYLLTEYRAFGLDFYTVNILYFLMPLKSIQNGRIVENQELKSCIIENIIPYELSKTQNLFQAIRNIVLNREYQKYHYEVRVLEKKLTWIRSMSNHNALNKLNGLLPDFPNVCDLEGYYMGLGVLNVGFKIPKGKFIGKFVGELLCPWREEEKQIVSTKHNQKQQNQGNEIKFYCITVQSHFDETAEPKCFTVDPQNVGNFCRSLNHSCDPNCKVETMVSQGKYILGIYAIKQIQHNEQLTFDYYSVTDNLEEYRNSVCLCGSLVCKGRYLNYKEQIQFSLDLDFLERQFPIRNRIKKLMRHCFMLDSNKKEEQLQKSLSILDKRKVFYHCIPKKLNAWIYFWLRALNHLIEKENEFLRIKTRADHPKVKDRAREESQKHLMILENEKLGSLNSKVQKIGHLFDKINDYSPPFESESQQQVLIYLEKILKKKKNCSYDKLKFNKNLQNRDQTLQQIREIRYGLLQMAQKELQERNDPEKSYYYLEKAFTFSRVKTYIYPDYESEPIEIWMQKAGKISEIVKFYGKDHYMLQTLVVWPGEFKKMYRKHQQEQRKNKFIIQDNRQIDGEMDVEFKREYFKKTIKEIASELEEDKYRLKKIDYIKDKKLMTNKMDINFKTLKLELDKWIEKELNFLYPAVNQFSKKIKNIRQDRSSTKFSIEFSRDSKYFRNNTEGEDGRSIEDSRYSEKNQQRGSQILVNVSLGSTSSKQSEKRFAKKGSKREQKQIKKEFKPMHQKNEQFQDTSHPEFILQYPELSKQLSSKLSELDIQEKEKDKKIQRKTLKKQLKPKSQTSSTKQKPKKDRSVKQSKQKNENKKTDSNIKKEPKPKKQPKANKQRTTKKDLKIKNEPKQQNQTKKNQKFPRKSAQKSKE